MDKLVSNAHLLREVTEPSFDRSAKPPTRTEIRERSATNADTGVFLELVEILGVTDIVEPHLLSSVEVDILASELIAVRNAKDVIEGRESALKKYATESIDIKISMQGEDPVNSSGFLVSNENSVRLSKEVTGGKLNIDIDLLKTILDVEQFASVTNEIGLNKTVKYPGGKTETTYSLEYELNEEALEKELKLGNLGMEQIIKATLPGKTRTAFYVRSAK